MAIVVAFVAILAVVLSYWILSSFDNGHDSISIEGNDDFNKAHGVRHGSGTIQDPYVIEDITISKGKGLSIRSTDAYAIIRSVKVEYSDDPAGGVSVLNSKNLLFEDLTIKNSMEGLDVYRSENCSFVRCDIDGTYFSSSVDIWLSSNCSLSDSRVSNRTGSGDVFTVGVQESVRCSLIDNEIIGCENDTGFYIAESESCLVSGNLVSNSSLALQISNSLNISVERNDFGTSYIDLGGTASDHYSTHTITQDNMVNGLPLRYLSGTSGIVVQNAPTGQLIAVNCFDFSVRNLSFNGGTHRCIQLAYCNRSVVEDIHVVGGNRGWHGSPNYTGYYCGIYTQKCENTNVRSCTIINVSSGIELNGRYMQASGNLLTNCESGITCGGFNLTVSDNEMAQNQNGVVVYGGSWTGNVSITNNNISAGMVGVKLSGSSNVTIRSNTLWDNDYGILLVDSARDILAYQNDFLENHVQAIVYGENASAAWDAGYPTGGNYWSDYDGVDNAQGEGQTSPGADGIGDSPYQIFWQATPYHGGYDFSDRYPLMNPHAA